MKIKVTYDNKTGLSRQGKKLIQMFEADNNFEILVKQARLKCGVKKLLNNIPTPEIYKKSTREAEKLVDLYNLPSCWIFSLQFFIVTGKFLPSGNGMYLSGNSQRLFPDSNTYKPEEIIITIYQKRSFDDLIKFIYANKSEIQERLKKLPRIGELTGKYFGLKRKIFELHTKYKMQPAEIEKKLEKLYPKASQNAEITTTKISGWIQDFKKALKGTPIKKRLI